MKIICYIKGLHRTYIKYLGQTDGLLVEGHNYQLVHEGFSKERNRYEEVIICELCYDISVGWWK